MRTSTINTMLKGEAARRSSVFMVNTIPGRELVSKWTYPGRVLVGAYAKFSECVNGHARG